MFTIDASIWVAAADATDPTHGASRAFLSAAAQRRQPIVLPAYALVEIACALARRRGDSALGRQLAAALLDSANIVLAPVDQTLLATSIENGTDQFLRAADALYAATAAIDDCTLISWDEELIRRAGAVTPSAWLAANP